MPGSESLPLCSHQMLPLAREHIWKLNFIDLQMEQGLWHLFGISCFRTSSHRPLFLYIKKAPPALLFLNSKPFSSQGLDEWAGFSSYVAAEGQMYVWFSSPVWDCVPWIPSPQLFYQALHIPLQFWSHVTLWSRKQQDHLMVISHGQTR